MFRIKWVATASVQYEKLRKQALHSLENRKKNKKSKTSPVEGVFKQVHKCIELLAQNPRHPGLYTHEYDSLKNPYSPGEKVFEAYAQNKTAGAYRIFWCYGPDKREITILAVTPHP
jgi:hypothetical protein